MSGPDTDHHPFAATATAADAAPGGLAAVGALAARVDTQAVADEVVSVLVERAALGYPPTRGETLELLRDAVQANIGLFAASLRRGYPPTDGEVTALAETLRAWAPDGMPLDEIPRTYRLAARLGWRHLRVAAEVDERAALAAAGEALVEFVVRAARAVSEACHAARDAAAADEERRARRLFARIAGTRGPDAETEAGANGGTEGDDGAALAALGLDLLGPHVPFAAASPRLTGAAHAWVAAAARDLGCLAVSWGDRVVGVAPDESRIAPLARDDTVATVLVPGQPVLRHELADACRSLAAVARAAAVRGRSGRVAVAELAAEALVELEPDIGDALVERVFGPLPRELARTLEVLVDHQFDRPSSAVALTVHRNTVLYRWARIESLTGLDLASARDRTIAYLAVARRQGVGGPA